MYVCLAACRIEFLEECRPIISLDTCHLKGFLKGQLLATVGIDGNDGMYPIAFAVCEGETKGSWSWFLELLLADIGPGLLPALATVAPKAHIRFCVRHLYVNFKKEHKGKLLKDLMWAAARETTRSGFEAKMEMMRNVDVNAYGHLMGIDCAHWNN
uniref:MULE transposase domain-containing protein n=1 Tax=Quercus lobata TaxID=97700 RepID=A0A7N2KNN0_QUELO